MRERVGVREPRVETAKSARYTGVLRKIKPRRVRGFIFQNVGVTVLLAVSGRKGVRVSERGTNHSLTRRT